MSAIYVQSSMSERKIISPQLMAFIRAEYRLDWHSYHGVSHWARVRYNGLRLARLNGANLRVVTLFAFLHDLKRHNEGHDPMHGPRAAQTVDEIRHLLPALAEEEIDILKTACTGHTRERTHEDLTVRTCWDVDRLDLGRVGIRPDPDRLCTPEARNPVLIEELWCRSMRSISP